MAQVTITVRKNGPLRIDDPNGVVEMVDADGNKYDLTGKTAFSLAAAGQRESAFLRWHARQNRLPGGRLRDQEL